MCRRCSSSPWARSLQSRRLVSSRLVLVQVLVLVLVLVLLVLVLVLVLVPLRVVGTDATAA